MTGMDPITTKASTERKLRSMLLALLTLGYGAWSLWDGYVAYPRANVRSVVVDKLGLNDAACPIVLKGDPTRDDPPELRLGAPDRGVVDRFGETALRHDGSLYYFGHGGYLAVGTRSGNVTTVEWLSGPRHTAADLAFQRVIGLGLLPIGLFFLIQLANAVTSPVVLSDAGLKWPGRRVIPWTDMIALHMPPSGTALLEFRDGGATRKLILDPYIARDAEAFAKMIQTRLPSRGS